MCVFVGIKSHTTMGKSSEKNLPVCNVPNSKILSQVMHANDLPCIVFIVLKKAPTCIKTATWNHNSCIYKKIGLKSYVNTARHFS